MQYDYVTPNPDKLEELEAESLQPFTA